MTSNPNDALPPHVILRQLSPLISRFDTTISRIAVELQDPFPILVGTVISLRTKDAVTAAAAARLRQIAPTPQRLAALPTDDIEKAIYPASFYKNKARHLTQLAAMVMQTYHGTVPSTLEELLKLPGVGRKTANLVLGLGFGIPAICVDIHVHRIANRLGWVKTKTPEETEYRLMELIPREQWIDINEILVRFGQQICVPVSPHCTKCPIGSHCPRRGVTRHR